MRLVLLFLCCVCCVCLVAQETGNTPNIRLIDKGIYRFASFTNGTVTFRNGSVTFTKLNFNITMDEMHFISPNGDTLAVGDPPVINYITIDKEKFYYDKGYLQIISQPGEILLAFKQELIEEEGTKGAFGITTTHPGANSYNYFSLKGQQLHGEGETKPYTTKEIYYFGDKFGHFSKANKEFLLTHYPKNEAAIKEFIKSNHTSFSKEEDLLKLLHFCEQLP